MMARESAADKAAREEREAAEALAQQSENDAPDVADSDSLVVKGVENGPVVLTRGGVEIARFNAEGGKITAKDVDERNLLLASVPGAHL